MPQLLPHYWVNQATWTLGALLFVAYVMSVYVTPALLELWVSRTYVSKL